MCLITQTFCVFAANILIDPTKPANFQFEHGESGPNQQQTITVNAVLKKGTRYSAIINGKNISAGDLINEWIVNSIDSSSVMLQLQSEPDSQAIQFRVSAQVNVKKRVIDNE